MHHGNVTRMARGSAAAVLVERRVAEDGNDRPRASGKFLFRGSEKLFLRAVSYGPFAEASHGAQFPERDMARRDFALMRDLGANCFRTFTPPPECCSTSPTSTTSASSSACH